MWGYVPWAEGGNGGTVSQVTVFGDGDEELDPGDWWVVSQGCNGEEGEKGKKGKKRKREHGREQEDGGTFWVVGELLIRTREEAETRLREALEKGDDGDDKGGGGDDNGEGLDKGGDKGGEDGGEEEGCKQG